MARLHAQATVLSLVDSPYVVQFVESGKSKEKNLYWIVTEFLFGISLEEYMEQNGTMQESEAIKVM